MYGTRKQPQMDDGLKVVQLLYTNGFLVESTQHLCMFEFSTLKEEEEGKRHSQSFSLFCKNIKFSLKSSLGLIGLLVSINSTNYQYKNNIIIVMT